MKTYFFVHKILRYIFKLEQPRTSCFNEFCAHAKAFLVLSRPFPPILFKYCHTVKKDHRHRAQRHCIFINTRPTLSTKKQENKLLSSEFKLECWPKLNAF